MSGKKLISLAPYRGRAVLSAILLLVLTAVLVTTAIWMTSTQYHFISRLNTAISQNETTVDMRDIIQTDWQLMCFSHPYDGPLKLDEFNRVYPPVADRHDGAWGWLFINSDGSPLAIAGDRSDGFSFAYDVACLSREDAEFEYLASKRIWRPKK